MRAFANEFGLTTNYGLCLSNATKFPAVSVTDTVITLGSASLYALFEIIVTL